MDNSRIKAIIFDLGGVLIDFDHTLAAKRISKFTHKSPEEIYELFFDSKLTGDFEEGKVSPRDFFQGVKEKLSLGLDFTQFVPIWNEIFFLTDKNHKVYNLACALKNKYRLALLSNINVLHYEYLRRNFSFFDAFDKLITSCELGFRKPHPLIYEKALRILGVLPEEVFYTDDRKELVESAKELGIKAVVFKDVEQLKGDLLEAGIV
jgi:putative hydrolase of the HAD superfamily